MGWWRRELLYDHCVQEKKIPEIQKVYRIPIHLRGLGVDFVS